MRLGTTIGAATAAIALLALLQARIIGAVAERIPSAVAASIVVIARAAIVGTCAILLRRFGFLPLVARLPDDFERRCPYPADSPEARILAVVFVARLRDG